MNCVSYEQVCDSLLLAPEKAMIEGRAGREDISRTGSKR